MACKSFDAIAALPRIDAGGAFATLPLAHQSSGTILASDVVLVNSVSAVTGSVHGTLYADQNNNAQRDASEGGLSGWTVFVDNNNNGTLDASEQSTTTNASGEYTLSDIPYGTFTLRAIVQPGAIATAPTTAARSITFTSNGQSITGEDFGIVQVLVPSLPDLPANLDTGADNADNITNQTALQFVVAGVVPGATVALFRRRLDDAHRHVGRQRHERDHQRLTWRGHTLDPRRADARRHRQRQDRDAGGERRRHAAGHRRHSQSGAQRRRHADA